LHGHFNSSAKHQAKSSRFKPMVRNWKNMRPHDFEKGLIKEGLASSYYLEGIALQRSERQVR